MLYATTRLDTDAYRPQRVLTQKRGCDGGLYVPFRSPQFSPEQIDAFAGMSFSSCVAEILNLQFDTKLTSWDLDFAVGRYPVRLRRLSGKILMAEAWHNTRGDLNRTTEKLAELLNGGTEAALEGDWISIAVRIAVLFGVYAELYRAGIADRNNPFDVSTICGDFISPVSAWYARQWGLPIGNIICSCNENSGLWNLIAHGQLRTDTQTLATLTPATDVVIPESLERLICAVLGTDEALTFAACAAQRKNYYLQPMQLQQLRQGLYVSVVSQPRMLSTVSNAFASGDGVLSPYDALCHGGLLDYRSRTGIGRWGLILSEYAPERDLKTISEAIGCTAAQLKSYLDKQ